MGVPLVLILATVFLRSSALEPLEELAEGNRKFSVNVYKNLAESVKGNLIVCPISAEIVLALLAEGARGPTQEEIIKGVQLLPDQNRGQQAFRSLLSLLNKSTQNLKLLSANKIYVANQFNLNSTYQKLAVDLYKAAIEKVAFADNVKAAAAINQWVEDRTNKKIQNLIDSNQLSESTRLVLVNALYFSGKWAIPFKSARTRKGAFYSSDNKIRQVDMMHAALNAKFRHCGFLQAKFLELTFKDSNISITFILPNDRNGIDALENRLEEYLVPHKTQYQEVDVSLPKFVIQTTLDFKAILKTLGVNRVFDPNKSDLSGLTAESREQLHVDFVVQKAYVNVTETGVEAAAATAGGVEPTFVPPPPKVFFNADHPFYFHIKENRANVILFSGRYST